MDKVKEGKSSVKELEKEKGPEENKEGVKYPKMPDFN